MSIQPPNRDNNTINTNQNEISDSKKTDNETNVIQQPKKTNCSELIKKIQTLDIPGKLEDMNLKTDHWKKTKESEEYNKQILEGSLLLLNHIAEVPYPDNELDKTEKEEGGQAGPTLREKLASEILSKGIAFANCESYLANNSGKKNEDITFKMRVNEKIIIYQMSEQIRLKGNIFAKTFLPRIDEVQNGKEGSPLLLFHGTWPFNIGDGAGTTLVANVHPKGPGFDILEDSLENKPYRDRLVKAIIHGNEATNHKTKTFGFSQGAALATTMAIEFPDDIEKSTGFNSPRIGYETAEKYENLSQLHHDIESKLETMSTSHHSPTKSDVINILETVNFDAVPPKGVSRNIWLRSQLLSKITHFEIDPAKKQSFVKMIEEDVNFTQTLIDLSQKVSSAYKNIPLTIPKLINYITQRKDKELDIITLAGHKMVGDCYIVSSENEPTHSVKTGLFKRITTLVYSLAHMHNMDIFAHKHTIQHLSPESLKSWNNTLSRLFLNKVQEVATGYFLHPLFTGLLNVKRGIVGQASDDKVTQKSLLGRFQSLFH